jgi:CheY-like chemotaxis protein
LRARQALTPIVMISAVPPSAQQALAVGVTEFLKMPFSLPELRQALTSLLPP